MDGDETVLEKLTKEELDRYDRQILIDEIGDKGQEVLKKGKVFISGAGGLGSPIALYLSAAGVGTITIVDHDSVSYSNLNRQVLHWEADIDNRKVLSAKQKLNNLNSHVKVIVHDTALTPDNAAELVAGHDVIIDALDNLEARFTLNQAALGQGIPFIHGAISGFEGRLLTVLPGKSTCLRCLHRGGGETSEKIPVVGVAPGVIGSLQATEAIKLLLNIGKPAVDRMVCYDGLTLEWSEFKVTRNPECDHCGHL